MYYSYFLIFWLFWSFLSGSPRKLNIFGAEKLKVSHAPKLTVLATVEKSVKIYDFDVEGKPLKHEVFRMLRIRGSQTLSKTKFLMHVKIRRIFTVVKLRFTNIENWKFSYALCLRPANLLILGRQKSSKIEKFRFLGVRKMLCIFLKFYEFLPDFHNQRLWCPKIVDFEGLIYFMKDSRLNTSPRFYRRANINR